MKIAVYCPLAPLDRFGYQYNHLLTIGSFCALADRVYLVSTSRNSSNIDNVLSISDKLVNISDERTWFQLDENGGEVFDVYKAGDEITSLITQQAKAEGMDCIINLHVNQYVPLNAVSLLKNDCMELIENGRPYGWLYRRYQLADKLFHTDTRLPWIVNLQLSPSFVYSIDSIRNHSTGEYIPMEVGDFRRNNDRAIVDAGMELTIADLTSVRKFTRNYMELRPGTTDNYDWEQYFLYYGKKYKSKTMSKDRLDKVGEAIYNNTRENFVSQILLREFFRKQGLKELLGSYWRKMFNLR